MQTLADPNRKGSAASPERPALTLEAVLAELEHSDSELRAALGREAAWIYQAPAGAWSAAQVLQHLSLTERGMYPLWTLVPRLRRWPGLIRSLDRLNSALWRACGMRTLREPRSPGQISSGRYVAPSFLRPSSRPKQLDVLMRRRSAVRKTTLQSLARIPQPWLETLYWSHPLLGRYSLLEFLNFIAIHERHHLAQIRNLRELFYPGAFTNGAG